MQVTRDSAGERCSTFADESFKTEDNGLVVLAQADDDVASEFADLLRPFLDEGKEVKANRMDKFRRRHADRFLPLERLFARCEISIHDSGIYKAETLP